MQYTTPGTQGSFKGRVNYNKLQKENVMSDKKNTTKKLSKKELKEKLAKSVKTHNRKVAADNAAFDKLKPAEKRVAIARDVLKHVASRRIIPTHGAWVDSTGSGALVSAKNIKKDPELQELFASMKSCNACALGGMFMCAVEKADNLKVSDLQDVKVDGNIYEAGVEQEDVFDYMKKFFSVDQLTMIESAFEKNEGACYDEAGDDFAPDVEDAADRMRLVMENIIVNKGTFKPELEPVATWTTPGFTS